MGNIKKGEGKWPFIYYALTPKGVNIATLRQQLIRGSALGLAKRWSFTPGGVAILAYFRKWKTQPRSIQQMWEGLPVGYSHVTKKALLAGIRELKRRGYIKLVK